jgi:alpha-tubulin suppressor-like RCC1 family protein
MFTAALTTTILAAGLLLAGSSATTAAAPAVADGSTFTSLSPVRVLDTRQNNTPVGPGGTVTLDLAARVPATATAVVLTVTGVTPTAPTHVTVFPGGTTPPVASNLNLVPGDIRANQVTVTLGTDRKVALYNNNGNVHLVADLAGYYHTGAGALFTALPANRVLDTRWDTPLGAGETRVLDLTNRIPVSATSVTFNLTATNPTDATFVTAWPAGTPRPTASNLNVVAGDTRPNLVTVAVGADRRVSLYNNAGSVELIADLTGFHTPDFGAAYFPLAPTRVLDTRDGTGTGGATTPVGPGETIELDLTDGLPSTATGVLLNITGVAATAPTYVTAWPHRGGRPDASTLNLSAGQTVPNAAMVSFRVLPGIELYNNDGSVHLVADIAGVFAVVDTSPCTSDCVLAWGDNVDRRLGTGQLEFGSPTPSPVVALSGVRAVAGAGAANGYVLRTDGTVRAWGTNDYGQLGNGWAANYLGGGSATPVPVVGLTNVTAITAGTLAAYALRADGTVWSWGGGLHGQLGNGHLFDSTVPSRVTGLTDVTAVSAHMFTVFALRRDGTVWAWGYNNAGQLGNGSTAEHSPVPVQVSGLTGVTAIASGGSGGYALRGDGTVWAWGNNNAGQLGNGSTVLSSPTPVQVSGLTGVTGLAAGGGTAYALRADGTAWAWGSSDSGALGNGVNCNSAVEVCESRVPVRVSGLSGVTALAAFDSGGYALLGDGTVRAWGLNTNHMLGNDQAGWVSPVPVPVIGLSGVRAIAGGWMSGYALR